jgi:hypothetical protein
MMALPVGRLRMDLLDSLGAVSLNVVVQSGLLK